MIVKERDVELLDILVRIMKHPDLPIWPCIPDRDKEDLMDLRRRLEEALGR